MITPQIFNTAFWCHYVIAAIPPRLAPSSQRPYGWKQACTSPWPYWHPSVLPHQGALLYCCAVRSTCQLSQIKHVQLRRTISLWAMMRNLDLSKHRSNGTFVNFSLQCKFELEDWFRAKCTFNWNRYKSCSASESLFWAIILDLSQSHWPKCYFSWRVTWKGDFFDTLKRQPTWYELILVDPQASWHWVDTGLFCSSAQQVVGGAIGNFKLALTHHVNWWAFLKTLLAISRYLNSFKFSEVCHYTVLNGTLVIPWVTSIPVQA